MNIKTVTKEVRKRLLDSDGTVVYYTLLVLDSVMNNCSTDVHSEVLSKEFMNLPRDSTEGFRASKSRRTLLNMV